MVAVFFEDEQVPAEVALQEFNRLVYKEQILQEAKKRMYYTPPSVKKREKRAKARKLRRLLARQRRPISESVLLRKAKEAEVIEKRVKQIKSSFAKLYKKVK